MRAKSAVALIIYLLMTPIFAADCESRLSQSEVDYGQLHRGAFPDQPLGQHWVNLDTHRLTLTVICQTPMPIKLRFNGTSAGPNVFRLGQQGQFSLRISDAVIDGSAALLTRDTDPQPRPEQLFDAAQTIQSQRARHFTAQIDVQAQLDTRQLQIHDETLFEAAGTFELLHD